MSAPAAGHPLEETFQRAKEVLAELQEDCLAAEAERTRLEDLAMRARAEFEAALERHRLLEAAVTAAQQFVGDVGELMPPAAEPQKGAAT